MKDGKNLKVEKGKQTIRLIMACARKLFAAKGYAATSAEEIVEAAGVTRGALYHHFDGKKGLFLAVVRQLHQEIGLVVGRAVDAEPDLFNKQIAGNDAFLEAASRPEISRILLLDAPAVLGFRAWRALDEEFVLGEYKRFLGQLAQRGIIRPVSAPALACLISGAANEGVIYIAEAEDRERALEEVKQTMARLINSLRA